MFYEYELCSKISSPEKNYDLDCVSDIGKENTPVKLERSHQENIYKTIVSIALEITRKSIRVILRIWY